MLWPCALFSEANELNIATLLNLKRVYVTIVNQNNISHLNFPLEEEQSTKC